MCPWWRAGGLDPVSVDQLLSGPLRASLGSSWRPALSNHGLATDEQATGRTAPRRARDLCGTEQFRHL